MPIFEYNCVDCGATLELLQRSGAPSPRRCGFRCALDEDSPQPCRGFGALVRKPSTFSTVHADTTRDHPDAATMARNGFAVYANEGNGRIRRIDGNPNAPDTIDVGDPHRDPPTS